HPWRDTDKRFGLWADPSVVKEDRSPSDAPCAPPVSRAQVRFNDVYGSLFEQCLMAENVGKEIPQRGRVDGWMNSKITLTSPRGFPTSGGPDTIQHSYTGSTSLARRDERKTRDATQL
ncbi:hypothetical protein Bpfe_020660, partial [Biomphalaria pfeifferi]